MRDKQGRVMTGGFSLVLGSVFCSYRREVGMLQSYELWSRVLTWDRKWMYFVTHFVAKGKGKGEADRPERIIATAISKYVFKLDRFTVHPSIILETSGLLPERPGAGWRGGELEVGDINDELELTEGGGDWDWRRTELERRRGMQVAQKFAALDTVHTLFDGGKDGILGKFALG